MSYVPKRKRRIRWKVVTPLLILLFLFVYIGISFIIDKTTSEDEPFTICEFNENETKDILSKKFADTYLLKDYLFYGETLNIFEEKYNPEVPDKTIGKTVVLKNICTGEEYPFVLEQYADRKIAIEELTPGYYEVYIQENLMKKRVIWDSFVKDSTRSIVRDGKQKKVTLYANKDEMKENGIEMDKNYLFIEVKSVNPEEDEIDILIDPSGYTRDFSNAIDVGGKYNGMVEGDETYKAAQKLKKELETYGLRVEISRKNDKQVINTYGEKGRLEKAYSKDAKYYIRLTLGSSNFESVSGTEIFYSSYSSSTLANSILYELRKETRITPSMVYASGENEAGLVRSRRVKGKDGRTVYDNNMYLREVGGKVTSAGLYSDTSEQNKSFATDNLQGVHGVVISYGYLSNKDDAALWREDSDKLVKVSADAIAKYLNIEKVK